MSNPNSNSAQDSGNTGGETGTHAASISVHDLTYSFADGSAGLQNVSLDLPAGSRTLLIGANGAGKTTILRLLAGKRLAAKGAITIAGHDPFSTPVPGITYLGTEWVLNPTVRSDIDVPTLLASVGGNAYPDRRDKLLSVLDIDPRWRLHAVSDGERRRVQLAMGLLRPWTALLLDEVTVDLDLRARRAFLDFLHEETERRSATVVYATHILDGLASWPTHLVHLRHGKVQRWGRMEEFTAEVLSDKGPRREMVKQGDSALGVCVLQWLEEDYAVRGPRMGIAEALNANTVGSQSQPPPSEGRANEHLTGIGGYGLESKKA